MPTSKIFGLRTSLLPIRTAFSDALHDAVVDALQFPREKRLQRFFLMDPEDFVFPPAWSRRYTIVEVSMFEGRSVATKKDLVQQILDRVTGATDLQRSDLDITIFETPRHAWALNGVPGEGHLAYKVEV